MFIQHATSTVSPMGEMGPSDLDEMDQKALTITLIQYGLRPRITSSCISYRFKQRLVNQYYKDIHKRAPTAGKNPNNVVHYLLSDRHRCLLSVMLQSYIRHLSKAGTNEVSPISMIRTFDEINPSVQASRYLSDLHACGNLIEMIYFAARDYRIGVLRLMRCTVCHTPYAYHEQSQPHPTRDPCPFCRVDHSLRLQPNGAALKPPRSSSQVQAA